MRKFLAVVRHEYRKVVFKWSFVIGTLLMPLILVIVSVIPLIIFSIKSGPTRIAVADPTGAILPRLERNLSADRMVERAKEASSDVFKNVSGDQEEQMLRRKKRCETTRLSSCRIL